MTDETIPVDSRTEAERIDCPDASTGTKEKDSKTAVHMKIDEQCHETGMSLLKIACPRVHAAVMKLTPPQNYGLLGSIEVPNNPGNVDGLVALGKLNDLVVAIQNLEENNFILARISSCVDGHTISIHRDAEKCVVYQSFYCRHGLKDWLSFGYHLAYQEVLTALKSRRYGIMSFPKYSDDGIEDWASWITLRIGGEGSNALNEHINMKLQSEAKVYNPYV